MVFPCTYTYTREQELDESAEEDESPVMRVDVATSGTNPPGSPQLEHRRHVLQQYSAHNLETEPITASPESVTILNKPVPDSEETERDILKTLPPKVLLVNTWEAEKSLPNCSQSSNPHSCHQMESLKESARMEPHMSPMDSYTSTRPFQLSSRAGERTRHQSSVKYDAWAVAKPNGNVKNTISSSRRLMTK